MILTKESNLELEEWKTMVLKTHPDVTFDVADDGHARALSGDKLVGTYSPDGVVWFLGRRKSTT
jgi:hypothetical protein